MNTVIAALLALIADQLLKFWTTRNIVEITGSKKFIPGFIHLTNIHNKGAAFGMMEGAGWLFVILCIIFLVVVGYVILNGIVSDKVGRTSLIMAAVGAVGNCIDRVMKGYVVDMFEFEFIKFPVFNIADILITVGAIIFCITIILEMRAEKAQKAQRAAGPEAQANGPVRARRPEAGSEEIPQPEKKASINIPVPQLRKRTKIEVPQRTQRPAPERQQCPFEDPFADWDSGAVQDDAYAEAEYPEPVQGGMYEVEAPAPRQAPKPVYSEADIPRRQAPAPSREAAEPVKRAPEPVRRQAEPAPQVRRQTAPAPEAPVYREPAPSAPPVQKAPAPASAPSKKPAAEEFNLDDILNEFRDIL